MKPLLTILALIALVSAASAFGLGEGNRFGKLGAISKGGGGVTPPPTCAGVIDMSKGCTLPMFGS